MAEIVSIDNTTKVNINEFKDIVKTSPEGVAIMVWGAPGSGKCFRGGTKILMFDGTLRNVEDIKNGDQVIGPDSKPRNVQGVTKGQGQLYTIVPKKGESFTVNDVHILSLKMSPTGKSSTQDGSIANISVNEYLLKSNTFRHHAKLYRTGIEWVEKPVSIPAYILGTWLANGDIAQPMFTISDKEVEKEVIAYAATVSGISMKVNEVHDNFSRISLTQESGGRNKTNLFYGELRNYGVTTKKHIPQDYLINSREIRLDLLAGLLDSDGSLLNNCFDIIQKSERLANDIVFLARSLGLAAYLQPCQKTCSNNGVVGDYFRITISGNTDMIPTKVFRKIATPRGQVKDVLVTGFSVEDAGFGDYYGFTLDSDHLFLLGDFTVTHNTKSIEQAAEEMSEGKPEKEKTILFYEGLTTKAPEDLEGVPFPIEGDDGNAYSSFLPPERFRAMVGDDGPPIILFLDELNTAQSHVQVCAMQIALEKRVGSLQLSKKRVKVIAAGNRASDRAAVNPMPKPLENRFEHYELVVDAEIWVQWALANKIDTAIIAYIRHAPTKLNMFKPDNASPSFATPRSYEMANKRLQTMGWSHKLTFKALSACIGEGVAREVIAFRALKDELPTVEEILADPKKVKVPDRPDRVYFVLTALVSEILTKPSAEKVLQSIFYVTRMNPEFGAKFFKDIIISKSDARKFIIPAFNKDTGLKNQFNEKWKRTISLLEEDKQANK